MSPSLTPHSANEPANRTTNETANEKNNEAEAASSEVDASESDDSESDASESSISEPDASQHKTKFDKATNRQQMLDYLVNTWPAGKWYPDKYAPRIKDGFPAVNIISNVRTITIKWLSRGWDLNLLWEENGALYSEVQFTGEQLSEASSREARKGVSKILKNTPLQNAAEASKDGIPGSAESHTGHNPDDAVDTPNTVVPSKKRIPSATRSTTSVKKPNRQQTTIPFTPDSMAKNSQRSLRSSKLGTTATSLRSKKTQLPATAINPPPVSDVKQKSDVTDAPQKSQRHTLESPNQGDSMKASHHLSAPEERTKPLLAATSKDSLVPGCHVSDEHNSSSLANHDSHSDLSDLGSLFGGHDKTHYSASEISLSNDESTTNAESLSFPTPEDLTSTAFNLRNNKWLTASNIQVCLRPFPASNGWFRTYPGFPKMDGNDKTSQSFDPEKKKASHIVMTLNLGGNHWVVGHWDIDASKFTVYDPIDNEASFGMVKKFMVGWMRDSGNANRASTVKFHHGECPRQEDTINCGIFCIAFAIALSKGDSIPQSVNPRSLRKQYCEAIFQSPPPTVPPTTATSSKRLLNVFEGSSGLSGERLNFTHSNGLRKRKRSLGSVSDSPRLQSSPFRVFSLVNGVADQGSDGEDMEMNIWYKEFQMKAKALESARMPAKIAELEMIKAKAKDLRRERDAKLEALKILQLEVTKLDSDVDDIQETQKATEKEVAKLQRRHAKYQSLMDVIAQGD